MKPKLFGSQLLCVQRELLLLLLLHQLLRPADMLSVQCMLCSMPRSCLPALS